MKKILFLLPLLGISSSLFAQAPQVKNVNAQQNEGTKDVSISFDISSRPGESKLNLEVWFKEDESSSSWTKVSSVRDSGTWSQLPANKSTDEFGTETMHSLLLEGVTETLSTKTLIWEAGVDAPDVNTPEAKIKLIAFYDKYNEDGIKLPSDQQVSGFDGVDDSGYSSGGDNSGNNDPTPGGLAVYSLTETQTSTLTDGGLFASGNYVIEIFTDEFSQEFRNLVPVIATLDGYERDTGKSQHPISSANFPTTADIDTWIADQNLVPVGTLSESDGGV